MKENLIKIIAMIKKDLKDLDPEATADDMIETLKDPEYFKYSGYSITYVILGNQYRFERGNDGEYNIEVNGVLHETLSTSEFSEFISKLGE